jgi:opacity protein-like surface antigen
MNQSTSNIMKKSSTTLAVLFCTFTQFVAHAGSIDPGAFASIGIGASHYSTSGKKSDTTKAFKFKVAPTYSMEVGYKFNKYLRAGLSPQYRIIKFSDSKNASSTAENINASSLSAMINAYLDLYNHSNFTPYVMAGAGVGTYSFKIKKTSAYKKPSGSVTMNLTIGAGVQAALSHNVGLDLTGRYSQLGGIKLQQKDAGNTPALPSAKKQKVFAKDVSLSLYMLL